MWDGNSPKLQLEKHAEIRLKLLATTDVHANLYPYNYYTDMPSGTVGLSRVASLVRDVRAAGTPCLLFDNGDSLQGTPLGDYAAFERKDAAQPHPVIAAMNTLGYDAATLGNHDFNYGLPFLEDTLKDADFPVVLANVRRADNAPFLPGSTLLSVATHDSSGAAHVIKVGVIGLTPPQIMKWDAQNLNGKLCVHDIVVAATFEISHLKAEGADLIVALCHSGIGGSEHVPEMENAIVPLSRLAGIDAIVAGHSHDLFPNNTPATGSEIDPASGLINGVPVVQPGYWGSHLGIIDLRLSQDQGKWRVIDAGVSLVAITSGGPGGLPAASDDDITQAIADDHQGTLNFIRRKVGETTVPIESYLSLISNSAAIQIVADAQRAYASLLLKDHPLAHLPLISAAAPFKAGGRGGPDNYVDIPIGDLAIKNLSDLYMYPNALCIVEATGAQAKMWLERAACAFHQIDPNTADQPLIDHDFAGYNFDVLDGLTYLIDVTVPAKFTADGEVMRAGPGRIRNLCHMGSPIGPEDRILIVTNNYRAAGGGHFAAAAQTKMVHADTTSVRDVLIQHVVAQRRISRIANDTWSFLPVGRSDILFETGPGLLRQPDLIKQHKLTASGITDAGFARFYLSL
jgi:2',3'-cyclic-nucleotide 2'-phosphodiesterase/3'-nucleotidase